jgi:enoyl-CoA hydratase/carnithine racemase
MPAHVRAIVKNQTGFVLLDRPEALNALSLEMIRAITRALLQWRDDSGIRAILIRSTTEKAFCAGGDLRSFHQAGHATPQRSSAFLEDFFTEEYLLNHLIHHYPKPYVAVMDGIVMGGGMGIAQAGPSTRMRIVTERTRMAMPEVQIGLFPDVGGSYFLSRTPGHIGVYLGVTGQTVGAADAIVAGLADEFVPAAQLPALYAMLDTTASIEIRDAVRTFAAPFRAQLDLDSCMLATQRTSIDRHFGKNEVGAIAASLSQDPDSFAQKTLGAMRQRSPLMMCVTLAQLRRGATMNFADCLRMERSMVRRCIEHGEVLEGIRARVIDKDNAPQWKPATLGEVTTEMVSRFFSAPWPVDAHPLRDLR